MTDYLEQVRSAIRVTAVRSPAAYSWFGKVHRIPAARLRLLGSNDVRAHLVASLQYRLYTNFYCPGAARPVAPEPAAEAPVPVRSLTFVERLSAANTGSGHPEPGWIVRDIGSAGAVLERDGLRLNADPAAFARLGGTRLAKGDVAALTLPKESAAFSPGFYLARSDAGFSRSEPARMVRLYWNVTSSGAPLLMRAITQSLNRAHVPFLVKVSTTLPQVQRCDAAVLYVQAAELPLIADAVAAAYRTVSRDVHRAVPAFTKALGPGLGFAEDPGLGESFGLHRCGLLADAIVEAAARGVRTTDGVLEVAARHFAERSLDLQRPYLNAGSAGDAVLPGPITPPSTSGVSGSRARIAAPAEALGTACEIGRELAAAAVWHGDRCNWVGATPVTPRPGLPATVDVAYATLGPDFYSGTSGVALFLAQLHHVRPHEPTRRAALGAIRHSLSQLDAVPPPARLGLYTGWMGIALAAARAGTLLADDGLLEDAKMLVRRCEREAGEPDEFDVISGAAGAICALLALTGPLEDERTVEFATRLGGYLVRTAERSGVGWSWRSATRRSPNLTGFSHGAAGAGHALLELFHATGVADFRAAAERAFEYERHWFDAAAGNWPDFRDVSARRTRDRRSLPFSTAWCHGAAGIGLSRVRAFELLGDGIARAEAKRALETTRRAVLGALEAPEGDFSLCHGTSGCAETLLYGCEALDGATAGWRAAAHRVACTGIERYARRGRRWPCGVRGEQTPGLMLGLAGIGLFYLRLHEPGIPSALIVRGSGRPPSATTAAAAHAGAGH